MDCHYKTTLGKIMIELIEEMSEWLEEASHREEYIYLLGELKKKTQINATQERLLRLFWGTGYLTAVKAIEEENNKR
jgi:hypothetical protein